MSSAATLTEPRFATGDVVLVRDDYPPGHIRTPVYVRGKRGTITRSSTKKGMPWI